jgi:hypothetical protein
MGDGLTESCWLEGALPRATWAGCWGVHTLTSTTTLEEGEPLEGLSLILLLLLEWV